MNFYEKMVDIGFFTEMDIGSGAKLSKKSFAASCKPSCNGMNIEVRSEIGDAALYVAKLCTPHVSPQGFCDNCICKSATNFRVNSCYSLIVGGEAFYFLVQGVEGYTNAKVKLFIPHHLDLNVAELKQTSKGK